MDTLPIFLKLKDRPVLLVGDGEAAEAKRRLLERAGAQVVTDEHAGAVLAIVALEDAGEAEATVARLKARGMLVNAVDRPALCDFTLPAIIDRSPVQIAIGTGGVSAGLAAALRQRLEALLPESIGPLAMALGRAREALRARWPHGEERRRAISNALSAGGRLDPLVADESAVGIWLAERAGKAEAARLVEIRLTSRDPEALTLREARLLALADRIIHVPDTPPLLLARARADAARTEGYRPPDPLPAGLTVMISWRVND